MADDRTAAAAVKDLHLFFEPKDRLRLTVAADRSYVTVKPAWSAPLSRPGKYLALLDGKGHEILTIDDPASLSPESLAAAEQELARRYLTSTVERIESAKTEFGATYWHVETDRGMRDFVTQSLQENAQWLTPDHLLLVDVDGNRFDIASVRGLDERSRDIVSLIL